MRIIISDYDITYGVMQTYKLYQCVYMCIYIYTHIHMYYIYAYVYIYIYIHTCVYHDGRADLQQLGEAHGAVPHGALVY